MADHSPTRLDLLLSRLKAGEEAALGEVLERAHARLRHLVSRILGGFPSVKSDQLWQTTDVTAELQLRLVQSLKEVPLAGKEHFFRLAAQKVRWLLVDLVRRQPGRTALLPQVSAPGEPPARGADLREVLARLLELLPELPEDQYAVLDMEFSLGLETGEIATVLGADESTIRRRRRRAYKMLSAALRKTFPGLGEGSVEGQS